MKCSYCGEEVGNVSVCPVCGSSVAHKAESAAAVQSGGSGGILQQIAQEKTALVEECAKSVSRITVDCGDSCFIGTGWCGYGNYIITNAHVVEAMKEGAGKGITCEFSDKLQLGSEQSIPVDIVYYSRVEDIAILLPRSKKLPAGVKVLKIEEKSAKQGELVFTIGNPLHYKFTYTEGAVSNPNYTRKGSKRKFSVLQTTLTLNHGNSGSPVMNANGNIVGMATFGELQQVTEQIINPLGILTGEDVVREKTTYKDIRGYGFCVKSEAILAAIKETEKH